MQLGCTGGLVFRVVPDLTNFRLRNLSTLAKLMLTEFLTLLLEFFTDCNVLLGCWA